MEAIPLEDSYADVVGKAQRGLSLSDTELAARAGLSASELGHFKGGGFDLDTARKVAGPLALGTVSLINLGQKIVVLPEAVEVEGLAMFTTTYQDMTVNSYLVFDPKTRDAAAFDTGATVAGMLEFAQTHQLKIESIFITHSHADHIADLRKLEAATSAGAYIGENERFHGPRQFAPGTSFHIGSLRVNTRQTSGHAAGRDYVRRDRPRPFAGNRGRRIVCGINGWWSGLVRRRTAHKSEGDFHPAGQHRHLPRPRPVDNCGRTKEAQPLLPRVPEVTQSYSVAIT